MADRAPTSRSRPNSNPDLTTNSTFSASPVAGRGHIYASSEDGDVYTIKAGRSYELVAVNPVGEALMATPAISDGILLLRGQQHIFALK